MADGAAPLPSTPGGVNRISALHDDLLHEIITRLPVMDAVRTAFLGRRWRHLWRSTPLVLRDGDLPAPARDALVPRLLRHHPGPYLSVRLTDCRLASMDPDWPHRLAARRTQRLVLASRFTFTGKFGNHTLPDPLPPLPARILRCASLQRLLLGFWALPVDLSHSQGGGVFLPHLRRLDLVKITANVRDLEDLIAACPVLKILTLTTANKTRAQHIRLRSGSLRSALVGCFPVKEFAVVEVDAPQLERLMLFLPGNGVRVKIGCAANLRVLSAMDTRVHRLHIGEDTNELNTITSTRTVIPSVKILAVAVSFGVLSEVKRLASLLRCFPNIDTLHIESALHDHSGEHHARFWQEISTVECLGSHIKKMVIHKFRGLQNEFEFLKFIAMNAQELQSLHVMLQEENISSTDMKDEIKGRLQNLWFRSRKLQSSGLLVYSRLASISILLEAADLKFDEPFDCSLCDPFLFGNG